MQKQLPVLRGEGVAKVALVEDEACGPLVDGSDRHLQGTALLTCQVCSGLRGAVPYCFSGCYALGSLPRGPRPGVCASGIEPLGCQLVWRIAA
eukprot:4427874-Pyramimonas_sp.AAC.1